MRKKLFFLSSLCLLSLGKISAIDFKIQPTPQSYVFNNDSVSFPSAYSIAFDENSVSESSRKLLDEMFSNRDDNSKFKVHIGVKGDKSVKKFSKKIPHKEEGYFLKIEDNNIVVAGNDERGLFYGLQTLSQLLTLNKLPECEVSDYPDIPYRGVVEGFYGTPWSHESRLRQIEFYGRNKMNVYIYGPKDDPYHSVPNWRIPYPEAEAQQLKQLVDKARENEVIFYWAIHPGQDIKWNEEDRQLLMNKFESMYELGVRAFAVFFDDISGEGTKAEKQAELLNYIDDNFIKVKGDIAPLVMCPTEYNKSWSNVKGGYLTTLGDKLNKGIEIMWTGDKVIACIDKQSMEFINPLLKRKAYIWWNFPVSDYVRDHLLLGPVYGNGLDIKDDLSAFVSNPMERPEASKIALYSVADYSWNLEDYNSDDSWMRSINDLMPNNYEHLKIFASHNSDLGMNGHGFRRDESVALRPFIEKLLDKYISSGDVDNESYSKVLRECENIIYSADMLLSSSESREFINEVKPWIMQFKLLGEYGKYVLQMIKSNDNTDFNKLYYHAKAIQNQMYEIDATYNQNPYQPGVKTGSKYLLPCFYSLFEKSTEIYNATSHQSLPVKAVYMPYTMDSNVSQLAQLPMRRKGKSGSISPSNEVIIWNAGGFVEVSMDYPRNINNLVIDLGATGIDDSFIVEMSCDSGKTWQIVSLSPVGSKTQYKAQVIKSKITHIRLTNKSDKEQRVYFKQFYFSE